jgi:hypothetical protein
MTPILVGILYASIGVIVGRILFKKRLGTADRYYIHRDGKVEYSEEMSSASTYGLWSIPLWPLILAIYIVQSPTPYEKVVEQKKELEKAQREFAKLEKEILNAGK